MAELQPVKTQDVPSKFASGHLPYHSERPIVTEQLDPGFQKFCAQAFARCRLWQEPSSSNDLQKDPLVAASPQTRFFLTRYGVELLQVVARVSSSELQLLRENARGLSVDCKSVSDVIKTFSPEAMRVVSSMSNDIPIIFESVRAWSYSLPNKSLHFKPSSNLGKSASIHRDISEAIALALMVGKLSEGQFNKLSKICSVQRPVLFAQAFSPEFISWFSEFQSNKGWHWRKNVEPGGSSHPAITEKSDANQVFKRLLSESILKYLLAHGQSKIEHLKACGEELWKGGWDLDIGEMVDPLKGVPLINPPRDYVKISTPILLGIAYSHHEAWLNARFIAAQIPDPKLHPAKRTDGADHHWDKDSPNDFWKPDCISAYGMAITLAMMHQQHPDKYAQIMQSAAI